MSSCSTTSRKSPPCTPPLSEASALSALPIAVSVAAPVIVLSAGALLTLVAVEASAVGSVWVLERASDGARDSVRPGSEAARALSVAAGTVVVVTAVLVLAAAAAQAGRSCENRAPTVAAIQRSMTLAEHTARALDQSGAQVVVLARAGQNLNEYDLRYSHLGFAYRDADQHWRIVHKQNQCGSANGSLYRQGLGQLFLDDLYDYEAAVVVPRPTSSRTSGRSRRWR